MIYRAASLIFVLALCGPARAQVGVPPVRVNFILNHSDVNAAGQTVHQRYADLAADAAVAALAKERQLVGWDFKKAAAVYEWRLDFTLSNQGQDTTSKLEVTLGQRTARPLKVVGKVVVRFPAVFPDEDRWKAKVQEWSATALGQLGGEIMDALIEQEVPICQATGPQGSDRVVCKLTARDVAELREYLMTYALRLQPPNGQLRILSALDATAPAPGIHVRLYEFDPFDEQRSKPVRADAHPFPLLGWPMEVCVEGNQKLKRKLERRAGGPTQLSGGGDQ